MKPFGFTDTGLEGIGELTYASAGPATEAPLTRTRSPDISRNTIELSADSLSSSAQMILTSSSDSSMTVLDYELKKEMTI